MPTRSRPLLRVLGSPVIALAAGVVFISTVWLLPISLPSPSRAGTLLAHVLGHARSTGSRSQLTAWFGRQDGRMVRVQDGEQAVTGTFFSDRTWDAGLWSPTSRTRRLGIWIDPGLSPAETAEVRRQFVDDIATELAYPAAEIAALRTGDVVQTRTLWWGYAHNAASLASFALLACSVLLTIRRLRESRRADAGLCPHCRYDLSGTPLDRPCPECGQARER